MKMIQRIKKVLERAVRRNGWTAIDREIYRQFLSFLEGERDMVFLPPVKGMRTKVLFVLNSTRQK